MIGLCFPLSGAQAGTRQESRVTHDSFSQWIENFREEARARGIPDAVLSDALADLEENEQVIALDRKQPEDKATFADYNARVLSKTRIARGRELMAKHRKLLDQISAHYQVQPQYIIALWGTESNFGANQGDFNVVRSLATLAYEGRRADFFRTELFHALDIIAENKMNAADLTGSWAGAMGNCQFMPSSYKKFAVDWDKSGHADIWQSLPDTFASIANYLHQSGWNGSIGWGGAATDMSADGLVTPGTDEEGVFSVTANYHVILKWNRSRYFAISVGMLADELVK
jgi:membrane-bound lytic murein transglycosylase B